MANTKNNLRYQATETKIKQAYLTLITKAPDRRVKVIDLCQTAAINRATFYAHYYDVEAVAEAIQQGMMGELVEALKAADLQQVFTEVLKLIKAQQTFFYHVFVTERSAKSIDVLQALAPQIEAARQKSASKFFNYQLAFFNGGMASLFQQWLQEDCQTPIPVLVELLMSKVNGFDA
jgi:AcrR family transcriptional regulator